LSSLNKVILIGRVVAQPELRYTPQGTPLAKFGLAVDRPKSKEGTKETDFFDIVAWRRLAEICGEYLNKGKLVCITGSIQTRSYETQDGQKRKAFEIQADDMRMLSAGDGGPGGGGGGGQRFERKEQPAAVGAGNGGNWSQEAGFGSDDIGMDDVPF
jgi:single-strand DNA-binding protein